MGREPGLDGGDKQELEINTTPTAEVQIEAKHDQQEGGLTTREETSFHPRGPFTR